MSRGSLPWLCRVRICIPTLALVLVAFTHPLTRVDAFLVDVSISVEVLRKFEFGPLPKIGLLFLNFLCEPYTFSPSCLTLHSLR